MKELIRQRALELGFDDCRFTSADPLLASANPKNPQSLNRYSYSLNNPYKYTDSSGLSPCDTDNRGEPVNIPVCADDPDYIPFIVEQVEVTIKGRNVEPREHVRGRVLIMWWRRRKQWP